MVAGTGASVFDGCAQVGTEEPEVGDQLEGQDRSDGVGDGDLVDVEFLGDLVGEESGRVGGRATTARGWRT
jgi:hypothetical protein